jgi:DNA-binding NtrC family response regulator
LRLLIVDDETLIADSLGQILRDKGFEVTVAYSGEQALECASAREPHILLSDVIMPGIPGNELAMRIAAQFPRCRIVLYSSVAVVTNLLQSNRGAPYPFKLLAKPIHPDELLTHLSG